MRKSWIAFLLFSACLLALIPPMHVRGEDGGTTSTTEAETTSSSNLTTMITSSTTSSVTTTAATSIPTSSATTQSSTSTSASSTLGESTGGFILKVDPLYHTIHRNGRIRSATYSVMVKALTGFRDEVELSIEGLPESSEAIFNPEEGRPRPVFLSILKIRVDSSTPAGTYTLTIIAASEKVVHHVTTTLIVEGEATTTTITTSTTMTATTPYEKRLKVTVSTPHENYKKGDVVAIFGYVKSRSGESVTGAAVSLNVVDPTGKDVHVKSMVTDQVGRYSDNFTLPIDAVEGTYAVYVSADMSRYRYGFTRATFTVGVSPTPSIRIVNGTIAMVNGTVSSEFHPGETFVVWVAVNNSGAELRDGRVWVEVLDANNVPITVVVVMATIQTGEQMKTGIQVTLKSDVPTGTYTIRCLVSNAPIMSGGRFLDMKEMTFIVT